MSDRANSHLSPFELTPILKEKVWGGRAVYPLLHSKEDSGDHIGEAWIVFGGNTIASGPDAGRTLDQVVYDDPERVLGAELTRTGLRQFPLLAKFLDAHENLSVQVHPDDRYAQEHEGVPFGKAEFWYILDAEPDARIIHGLSRPVEPHALARELQGGKIDDLEWVPVAAGDVILNLPGTIHATGAGIVLYELQQSSDVTYRLYDWDRGEQGGQKRELHLDSGMAVADLQPPQHHKIEPVTVPTEGGERTVLCACRYFAADLVALRAGRMEMYALPSFHAWTVLSGSVIVGGDGSEMSFGAGSSFVVPAGLREYSVSVGAEGARAIRAYVPDLRRDVLEPLEAQDVPRERILQLAGDSGQEQFGPNH